MKKRMCEIAARNKRGNVCKKIAACYESGVPGLVVTINYFYSGKDYSLTHVKSGYRLLRYDFPTIKKTKEIASLFFADCDWTQASASRIVDDPVIAEQHRLAYKFLQKTEG